VPRDPEEDDSVALERVRRICFGFAAPKKPSFKTDHCSVLAGGASQFSTE
jgi:hypothetical protein